MNNVQQNIIKIAQMLQKHKVEYMFIGKGAAMVQGFPDTTQDADIYPEKSIENGEKLLVAMKELGFELTEEQEQEITNGKDFMQFMEPFEFDVVFSPDGFDGYQDAVKYKRIIGGIPVMAMEGIIRSKKAAGRQKDRESLPRLISFAEWLKQNDQR